MENTNKFKNVGFSAILWAVIAAVLCAAPPIQADVTVPAGQEWDIDYDVKGFLYVDGIANLDTGAYAAYGIEAHSGSTVNIWGGNIGAGFVVTVFAGTVDPPVPAAVVTVYGTAFAVSSGTIEADGSWTPGAGGGILTGEYENGNPEDPTDDINLLFYSDIPIYLEDTGSGSKEPIPVDIDIKPGSYPNSINLGSNGVIPVAILSTDIPYFDATLIPAERVFLAGAGVVVRAKGNNTMAHEEDINEDGLMDLVVKVETENLKSEQFQDGGAYLRIHESSDPESPVLYEGWDEITIVPPE